MGRVVLDRAALNVVLRSRTGPVAVDLTRRAVKVQNRARTLAPVDRGRLRSSITHELATERGELVARVGTNVEYALAVHNGTGVYGPSRTPIKPVSAKVLRWPVRGTRSRGRGKVSRAQTATGYAFARQVRGVKGRPFLRNALPAATQ